MLTGWCARFQRTGENIDWNIGRILKKLDELKLAENTIVVYFSDKGPADWRWNGGMKGKKGSTDEGGVREPCLVRWPGRISPNGEIPQIPAAIDILPTLASLASLAGIPVIGDKRLDGLDLTPLLQGKPQAWPDRMIFNHFHDKTSVRTEQYRLDAAGALFDMQSDPGQWHDIAAEKPDVVRRLSHAVADWLHDVLAGRDNDSDNKDDRPFPVGYAAFPTSFLPARDGIASGGVKRSAGAPNCSYYTNWRSTRGKITWDVEVATAGRYEALLYYNLPQGGRGCHGRDELPGQPPARQSGPGQRSAPDRHHGSCAVPR